MKEFTVDAIPLDLKNTSAFKIKGSVDSGAVPMIEKQLNAAIGANKRYIAVDLSGVDFINSAGVGVFLSAATMLREKDGDLVFMNVPDEISEILEVMNLDDFFRTISSINELEDPSE